MNKEKLQAFWIYCKQPKNKWDNWDFFKAGVFIVVVLSVLFAFGKYIS